MPINQPANQIKLTNVSIVRLRKAGKRFEIACYKNKVMDWRSGTETELDEVIQIENIFSNVSKGALVPQEDLKKAFGSTNVDEIIKEILKKGELQVGEKERNHELSTTWKEIVTLVCEKCVDPGSQRPYPSGMIDKAMSDIHYSIKTGKSTKSQALDVIRQLQASDTIPIERAKMRIRLTMANKEGKRLKEKIIPLADTVEDEDWTDEWELVAVIEPGSLRKINELLEAETKGRGKVEVLSFTSIGDDEEDAFE
ncbi:hypothetical protein CBS101457_003631 [Exobasidium rhododendri]|nr:hypothetical protein CBS101457_003631 [Exobasidium rhododendri]